MRLISPIGWMKQMFSSTFRETCAVEIYSNVPVSVCTSISIPTSHPVVMDRWPPTEPVDNPRFTTVTTWRGPYGPVELNGDVFAGKHQEFRRFAGLPARAARMFEIATSFHEADDEDRVMLAREGWRI